MKKRLLFTLIIASTFYGADAQNLDFGSNFNLDITDPCSISGSFEITYDDEANASYPNTGPFLTYLKLINTSNQDVQVPTTIDEPTGLNAGVTQEYTFSNVDVTSIVGFVPGQEYRVELHIDPFNQVFESAFNVLDTMTIGYTTCTPVGITELFSEEKKLVNIVDFMGRKIEFKPNTPLIFIYSDGTRERVMKIEE